MRIGRTLPPAAAPLSVIDLFNGITGIIQPEKTLSQLQSSLCKSFKKKHCFLVSSGKAAITLTLNALSGIYPDRNEVIIPAFNCYSVPSAIVRAGLIVSPCDIAPETLQFQKESLERMLKSSSKILAIMPTHLFGLPSDTNYIRTLTNNTKVTIIEDAAQSMGSEYNGKHLGTDGDVGIFSLGRGKAISAGEGAVILTDSDQIADKILLQIALFPKCRIPKLVNLAIQSIALTILINPMLFWILKMMPFLKLGETVFDPDFPIRKFSSFQAGLVKNWKSKIALFLRERSRRVKLYSQHLCGIKGVSVLADQWNTDTLACIRFPVLIQDEKAIKEILIRSEKEGLGISKSYPDSIDTIKPIMTNLTKTCINAHNISQTLITLPCHPMVRKEDIVKISHLIQRLVGREK